MFKKKDFVYFVSYNWMTKKQYGFGQIEIFMTNKITSIKDIKSIKQWIDEHTKDEYGEQIDSIVMNYSLMRRE